MNKLQAFPPLTHCGCTISFNLADELHSFAYDLAEEFSSLSAQAFDPTMTTELQALVERFNPTN